MPTLKGSFEFSRFQIAFRAFGSGENIVCLNGAQQSMAMWWTFLQRFQKHYRIILFDFPHQGKSKIFHGALNISLEEQVEILAAVIRQLEIETATICSSSWGGVVALLFAWRYPQHAQRLILASFGMRPNLRMRNTILAGRAADLHNRDGLAQILIKSFGDNLPEIIKEQIVNQFNAMSEERIQAFAEHGMSVICTGSLEKVVPLAQIKTPVILLYGENDQIIDFSDVQDLSYSLSDCQVVAIPEVGHFLHLENEKVFDTYEKLLSQWVAGSLALVPT